MEVPEWGAAPEEDYPSLLAPDNMPASDNARKKAKRRQKQQQEHLQHLIHAPVHLVSTTVPSGQAALKQQRTQQDPHMSQAEAQAYSDQLPVATSSASQSVKVQAVKGKKRARSSTSRPEAGDYDDSSSSKQTAAQLPASAQAGKQRAAAREARAASKSALQGPKADQKLDMAVTAGTKQRAAAKPELQHTLNAGVQPKVKRVKAASHTSSKPRATDCPQGNIQAESVSAQQQAASNPAAGENRPDVTAAKGKQKKLGRNARLRLKRQAYRQQALLSSSTEPQGQPAAEAAIAQPAAHLSKKAKAAGEESLSAVRHGRSPIAAGSGVQAVSGDKKQVSTVRAKPGGSVVKQRQQPAASATAPAEKPDSLPAGKLKKKGLLEQMRSKLSGGRFRMLNEQLYTSEGQHAFQMMQAQPDLYQQYHEGFREQTQHWPVQPIDIAIAWLKKKSPTWVAADFGCGDAQLGSSVPQAVHSLDLVATAPGVTACNMAHTPLESASIDAAVFCLALMGTDYGTFIEEAWRVLRPGGLLWIAEVRSRFVKGDSGSDVFASFVEALKQQGLVVTQQDSSNKMFVVFEAKKVADRCDVTVQWPELKPCLYKRR